VSDYTPYGPTTVFKRGLHIGCWGIHGPIENKIAIFSYTNREEGTVVTVPAGTSFGYFFRAQGGEPISVWFNNGNAPDPSASQNGYVVLQKV
jgi:hypothetical protein